MGLDKTFTENARDLTIRYGLKAASLLFAGGSAYLMARSGFDPENAKLLRHVLAPALLFAANVAGFFNRERLQNSLGVVGAAVMATSFAGADGDAMAVGQTTLWAGGVVTGLPGSHLAPAKQRRMEKENLTHIAKDGMVQTATIQGAGNAAFFGLAFAENTLEMVVPYGAWVVGSALKSARAILNAKRRLRPETPALPN